MAEVKSMGNLNHTTFEKTTVGDTIVLKGAAKTGGNLYLTEAEEAGITKAEIKKIADFNAEYNKQAVARMVKEAGDELNAHKATALVKASLPCGINANEKVEVIVQRERTSRNPKTGETSVAPAIKVKISSKSATPCKSCVKELKAGLATKLGM